MNTIKTDSLESMVEITYLLTVKGARYTAEEINGIWIIEITGY